MIPADPALAAVLDHSRQCVAAILSERGLTWYRAAVNSGIAPAVLSRWLSTPGHDISLRRLAQLARYLELDLHELVLAGTPRVAERPGRKRPVASRRASAR